MILPELVDCDSKIMKAESDSQNIYKIQDARSKLSNPDSSMNTLKAKQINKFEVED